MTRPSPPALTGTDPDATSSTPGPRVGYVLKMYPRFSETFIVTEILAREAAGADLEIFSLRAPTDPHFHGALSLVQAPVRYIPRVRRAEELWQRLRRAEEMLGGLPPETTELLLSADAEDAAQALDVAVQAHQRGITHLHAHFASVATTVARLAARLAGITYSFTTHAKDLFHSAVDNDDVRAKAADAHHVVTISRYNVGHLLGLGVPDDQVHLVYNGLDLQTFRALPRQNNGTGTIRIVAVGRLIEKKGFEDLIDACHLLHAAGRSVRCDIVGSGERADALAGRISALGLEGVVNLRGPLPQEQVRQVVAGGDVLAAPCVVGSDGNTDGLPTVVLEAMALGTPCVTTDVTGLVEVIDHERTGLLVPQHDPASLAWALERLSTDTDLADRVRAQARALIESTFDSRRQARALAALDPQPARAGVGA
ncbi:glycosyltransferase family 4 protein [Pseudactinotalea sp. Z1739]|uniref:glycosyltransferase family 4 protein n=1 Tax=Pseudactinotalea sp. Z1739 TaxID=3413028 RepID=UPI003C7D4CC9